MVKVMKSQCRQQNRESFSDLIIDEWCEVCLMSCKLHYEELIAFVSWQRQHKLQRMKTLLELPCTELRWKRGILFSMQKISLIMQPYVWCISYQPGNRWFKENMGNLKSAQEMLILGSKRKYHVSMAIVEVAFLYGNPHCWRREERTATSQQANTYLQTIKITSFT